MVISDNNTQVQEPQHSFLVAWGWFAVHIGLVEALQGVPLHQKYTHAAGKSARVSGSNPRRAGVSAGHQLGRPPAETRSLPRRPGRASGPMPRWSRGPTRYSHVAHTLWTWVWDGSTPARRSSTAPCCISAVTR